MNGDELRDFIPQFLEQLFPGMYSDLAAESGVAGMSAGPWLLLRSGSVSVVVPHCDVESPHVRIKSGVALHVPLTPELGIYVATANKQLWNGRAYIVTGDGKAIIALEELVFAAALSYDFVPGLQDLATRVSTLTTKAGALSQEVLERFGGQRFEKADSMFLSV